LAALTVEQTSDLISVLCYWFSLVELEDLAFDLGLGSELYGLDSKQALAQGMVRAVMIMGRLGCLVDRFAALAPEAGLDFFPDSLPACIRHRKLQVLLPTAFSSVRLSRLKRELSRVYKVTENQISIVAAAGPRARLLVSVPDNRPAVKGQRSLRGFRGAVVRPYERLDSASRRTWRWVAQRLPPELSGDQLSPDAAWGEVRRQVRWRALAARLAAAFAVGGIGVVGYLLVRPWMVTIRLGGERALRRLVTWALPWAQFLGSVAFSAAGLAWSTVLFFGLLALGLRALPAWMDRAARRLPGRGPWLWLRDGTDAAMNRHPRLVGTLLNLLSSTLALGLFSALTGQPLDEWDLGIQGVIALLIELVVLGVILRVRSPSAAHP